MAKANKVKTFREMLNARLALEGASKSYRRGLYAAHYFSKVQKEHGLKVTMAASSVLPEFKDSIDLASKLGERPKGTPRTGFRILTFLQMLADYPVYRIKNDEAKDSKSRWTFLSRVGSVFKRLANAIAPDPMEREAKYAVDKVAAIISKLDTKNIKDTQIVEAVLAENTTNKEQGVEATADDKAVNANAELKQEAEAPSISETEVETTQATNNTSDSEAHLHPQQRKELSAQRYQNSLEAAAETTVDDKLENIQNRVAEQQGKGNTSQSDPTQEHDVDNKHDLQTKQKQQAVATPVQINDEKSADTKASKWDTMSDNNNEVSAAETQAPQTEEVVTTPTEEAKTETTQAKDPQFKEFTEARINGPENTGQASNEDVKMLADAKQDIQQGAGKVSDLIKQFEAKADNEEISSSRGPASAA